MTGVRPKKKCCTSKPRCRRCPIRLLSEGSLPPGYTVRRRKLVRIAGGAEALVSADADRPKKKRKKNKKKLKNKKIAKAGKVALAA